VTRLRVRSGWALPAVCGLVLAVAGCATPESSASPSSPGAESAATPAATAEAGSDRPFGADCSAVPPTGEGSFAGMADDRVATAGSHNPGMTAWTAAVGAAHLGASFDAQEDVTVLAPVDAAFAAVPRDSMRTLVADTPRLTAVLTHHVLQGRLAPEQLAGTHTTLNNDQVTIEVSPEAFTVAAEGTAMGTAARVICGNVQTVNATVYLIDQVLAPPAG
jgi:uncharacterized surface protein with fasciclin (FAS1) repeats